MASHDVHGRGSDIGVEHSEDRHVEEAVPLLLTVGDGIAGVVPLRGHGDEAECIRVAWMCSQPWV